MSVMNFQSNYEQRLFHGLLALLVWLPLPLASNRPWAEALFEIWVVLLVLLWLVAWQRKAVESGTVIEGAKPILWLFALWLFYLALTLFPLPLSLRLILSPESAGMYQSAGVNGWVSLSVHPYAGFLFLMKSAGYTLLFILILLLVNSKRRLVMLAYTLVLSGLFQAFYGSMMTLSAVEYGFFIKKEAYLGFATGTFVNRNHLAGYLEMILAIGIGLMMASASSRTQNRSLRQRLHNLIKVLLSQKLLLRLMLAMMVIALVLTRSRMGNTAFFSSMLVAGLMFLLILRVQSGSFGEIFSRPETRGTVILLSSLMLIDLFIVGAWFGVEKVVARIEQSSAIHDADRIEVSLNAIKLWQDYPLVGSGGGSFHTVYPRYRPATIGAFFDHVHEDYLEIAADTGLVGLGLMGLMVLLSFVVALLALKRRRNPLMRGMAFASVMGIISLLIHSTVDFNLQIPANSATFMVILALGWIVLNLGKVAEVKHEIT